MISILRLQVLEPKYKAEFFILQGSEIINNTYIDYPIGIASFQYYQCWFYAITAHTAY